MEYLAIHCVAVELCIKFGFGLFASLSSSLHSAINFLIILIVRWVIGQNVELVCIFFFFFFFFFFKSWYSNSLIFRFKTSNVELFLKLKRILLIFQIRFSMWWDDGQTSVYTGAYGFRNFDWVGGYLFLYRAVWKQGVKQAYDIYVKIGNHVYGDACDNASSVRRNIFIDK